MNNRQFEFPYNFDKKLIETLSIFDPEGKTINCIYMPPYIKDYQTILRNPDQAKFLDNLSRYEYEEHIHFINSLYPNKIQILLQRKDSILNEDKIKYYINLGITNFCVANIDQAKIIKKINNNIHIVGSIAMQINKEKIIENLEEYKLYFDSFVLPFYANRHLEEIKKMPKNFHYILLVNSYCNFKCNGKAHWNFDYKSEYTASVKCPGLLGHNLKKNEITWEQSCLIRPMDLAFFDPYISVYKLQDRGWPTEDILRNYILYTSDYFIYPNIKYDQEIYCNGK